MPPFAPVLLQFAPFLLRKFRLFVVLSPTAKSMLLQVLEKLARRPLSLKFVPQLHLLLAHNVVGQLETTLEIGRHHELPLRWRPSASIPFGFDLLSMCRINLFPVVGVIEHEEPSTIMLFPNAIKPCFIAHHEECPVQLARALHVACSAIPFALAPKCPPVA